MKLRRGGGDAVEEAPAAKAGLLAGASAESLTRLATFGLWALVAAAALAGCGSFITRPKATGPARIKVPAPTVGPEGFAELYVSTFLESGEGDEARLRAFYPGTVQLRDVIPGSLYVARTATVDAKEVARRYWSVTVAAEVLIPEGSGYRRAGTRFYQVGVAGADVAAYVATSLPGEVPPPATLGVPPLEVGSLERVRPGDPVAGAVERFAAAFLAGDGELVRYMAPDAALRAVSPPPFVAVKVTDLAVHDVVGPPAAKEVLAAVRATDSAGRVQILHYSLELAERSGRWEVARLLPGPPLQGPAVSATDPAGPSIGAPATTPARGARATTTSSAATTRSPNQERTARP
ncbi:MAG TPA: conjugal transfer protein [Acidimicrobiales bacterium]|nr:conjugal transfer protein [Acidimicrobiales bacterium]